MKEILPQHSLFQRGYLSVERPLSLLVSVLSGFLCFSPSSPLHSPFVLIVFETDAVLLIVRRRFLLFFDLDWILWEAQGRR